jgi:hypothetical protein
MKKLKFLVNVPDKYTKEMYEEGQVKEFEDDRADEILSAKQSNGESYVEEVKEEMEEKLEEKPVKRGRKKKAE